ncbi:DUF362 domain-containing protein [Chloroflexota bacterium]
MIYLSQTRDREGFTRDVLRLALERPVRSANKVLVKPNIVSHEPYPTTTHPAVLRACLECFLAWGKEVAVADGPAPDAGDSGDILGGHPLKRVCDDFDVPLVDLTRGEMKTVESGGMTLELSSLPFEYDFILSLPVLKSHLWCDLTGALKNQFGLLSNRDRMSLHFGDRDIHRAIAELNRVLKTDFYIMDAVETLTGANEVRHGGRRRTLGFMAAGSDPVGLDALGLGLFQEIEPGLEGKSPVDIPYLKYAIELELGSPDHDVVNPSGPAYPG